MLSNPSVTRRLLKEIKSLKNEPQDGIRITTGEDNIFDVTGIVAGPTGTPYEGGFFRIQFEFTDEFPATPPKCRMLTKIFHPNVSASGEICVNTLKKDWKSTYGIQHILVTVRCLLIYPNPESALDEEAGRELLENYEQYASRAKLITKIHATPKTPLPEFAIPSVPSKSAPSDNPKPVSTSGSTPPPPSTLTVPKTSDLENATANLIPTKPRSKSGAISIVSIAPSVPLQPALNSAANAQSPLHTTTTLPTSTATDITIPASPPAKAIKRAAPVVATGAEKRKKALKRL